MDPRLMPQPPMMPLPQIDGPLPGMPPLPMPIAQPVPQAPPLLPPPPPFSSLDHATLPMAADDGEFLDDPEVKQAPYAYTATPKPKLDQVLEWADDEKSAHQDRIAQSMMMDRRLNLEVVGAFERDRALIKRGKVETFIFTDLRDEHDAARDTIAGMDWHVDSTYRDAVDEEESQAKEDFVRFLWQCEERQHMRTGYSPLKLAIPDILQRRGMLVGFDGLDVGDYSCGMRMALIDPLTCFPVFAGAHGLETMYRVYYTTGHDVIGTFAHPENDVESRVRKITGATKRDPKPLRDLYEVVEMWDSTWTFVSMNSDQVLLQKHDYGRNPYTVVYGCFGQPGVASSPYEGMSNLGHFAMGDVTDRKRELTRLAQPFLQRRTEAHDMEESVAGRLLTEYRRSQLPPLVITQTSMNAMDVDPKINNDEEEVTRLGEGETIVPLPNRPAPEVLGPLMQALAQNKATGMASGVLMGQSPMSQASGSAIDILAQSGFQKWSPLVFIQESFLQARAEWRMQLYESNGDAVGGPGRYGSLSVPRSKPSMQMSQVHEITPDLIKRTGTYVDIRLQKFNPSSLAAVANGINIARAAKVMSQRSGISILGYVTDPDAEIERIEDEVMNDVPEVATERMVDRFVRRIERARRRGDTESANMFEARLTFLLEQKTLNDLSRQGQMAQMQMQQQLGSGPGAMGMSNPMMGNQSPGGQQGGRPMKPPVPIPPQSGGPPDGMG